jgi:endonuclease-8
MPEGDTILRMAQTLDRWLAGREITAARSANPRVGADRLVGRTVLGAEAQAKHLLVRFGSAPGPAAGAGAGGRAGGELTLRTHQRMRGNWQVFTAGSPWRRPEWQAQIVLEAGDRLAVCFNSPVVELFPTRERAVHPVLRALGPDVLAGPVPAGEVWSRAVALLPPDVPVGELLLDQRVVGGIGNIWRSESLFVCGIDPWRPWPASGSDGLDRLAATAGELMGEQLATPARPGGVPRRRWVYGRSGRPCWRCWAAIRCARIGTRARTVWWCPTCQAPDPARLGPHGGR